MKRMLQKVGHQSLRTRRHNRVRARVVGTSERPRLSVFRSLKQIQAQLIDDAKGITLCSAGTIEVKEKTGSDKKAKVGAAYAVGKLIAEKAKSKGITQVVFDRGGYQYHGRVQAVAEGAREGGLEF